MQILVWKELNYGQMREKEKQLVVSEVNILRELRHPMIVRYYDRCAAVFSCLVAAGRTGVATQKRALGAMLHVLPLLAPVCY